MSKIITRFKEYKRNFLKATPPLNPFRLQIEDDKLGDQITETYENGKLIDNNRYNIEIKRGWINSKKQFAWQFWLTILNLLLVVAAFSSFIVTLQTYSDIVDVNKNTIEINKNLNRPYIDLDAKSIKENLIRLSEMIPVGENLYREIPTEQNLQFSIKNYGVLPAKYKIDFSDFRNSGFQKISEDVHIEYIYPDQSEELIFTYDYDSRVPLERMREASDAGQDLFGDASKIEDEYIIKIKYGFVYQSEKEFPFEAVIRRKYFRVPCEDGQDLKNSNVSCWHYKWIIERAN